MSVVAPVVVSTQPRDSLHRAPIAPSAAMQASCSAVGCRICVLQCRVQHGAQGAASASAMVACIGLYEGMLYMMYMSPAGHSWTALLMRHAAMAAGSTATLA